MASFARRWFRRLFVAFLAVAAVRFVAVVAHLPW